MDIKVIGVTMEFEAGVAPEPLVCWGFQLLKQWWAVQDSNQ